MTVRVTMVAIMMVMIMEIDHEGSPNGRHGRWWGTLLTAKERDRETGRQIERQTERQKQKHRQVQGQAGEMEVQQWWSWRCPGTLVPCRRLGGAQGTVPKDVLYCFT